MPATLRKAIAAKSKAVPRSTPEAADVSGDVARAKMTKNRLRKIRDAADFLKHGADPTRLNILLKLKTESMNLTKMAVVLGIPNQPSLGHHFAMLRHGGIIEMRRAGTQANYNLTPAGLRLVETAESFMTPTT